VGQLLRRPPELSTTIEAYVALRLAGDCPRPSTWCAHRDSFKRRVDREQPRLYSDLARALRSLAWSELPVIPAELMFLPHRVPLNIYDFACWARQTVVSLTIVSAHRPTHQLNFDVAELKSGVPAVREKSLTTWAGRFFALDRLGHVYERRPIRSLRRALCVRLRTGSSSAKRPTVRGAAFSHPGSTPSSRYGSRVRSRSPCDASRSEGARRFHH